MARRWGIDVFGLRTAIRNIMRPMRTAEEVVVTTRAGSNSVWPARGAAADFEETRMFDPAAPDGVGARPAAVSDTGFAETRMFDPAAPDGVGQQPSARRSASVVDRIINQAEAPAVGFRRR